MIPRIEFNFNTMKLHQLLDTYGLPTDLIYVHFSEINIT